MRTWGSWALVVAALCALAALSWWWAVGSQSRVDPEFTQAVVDLNRRLDDHATAVAYDPQSKILAVGRNSGALELWDARRSDSRIAVKAHSVRIEHIAFGAGDGIVLTSSARSEEHTSELQSLMRISYAVFCLKKKKQKRYINE